MSIETESHEFMGWYEGFHTRDGHVATLTAKIESDAKVIAALREKLKLMDDYYQTGGDLMSHMAHMAQDALAIIEQIASECPDCGGMGFTDQPCPKCGGDF